MRWLLNRTQGEFSTGSSGASNEWQCSTVEMPTTARQRIQIVSKFLTNNLETQMKQVSNAQ